MSSHTKRNTWINLCSAAVKPNSRVWVLDRRAFQQIMMRTGLQRIEENVRFLKSVPLLHHLDNDVLAKIADVLELVSACFLVDFLPRDKNPKLAVNKLTDAELYWIIHGWLLRKVNLQSCNSLFTYSFKYLEPLEAHFRFLSYLRSRWRHQDSSSQARHGEGSGKESERTWKLLVNICLFTQTIRSFIRKELTLYARAPSVTISF